VAAPSELLRARPEAAQQLLHFSGVLVVPGSLAALLYAGAGFCLAINPTGDAIFRFGGPVISLALHTRRSTLPSTRSQVPFGPFFANCHNPSVKKLARRRADLGSHEPKSQAHNNCMILETFPVGMLQCNCTLIGDENTHDAMVIDPGDNIPQILARLQKHALVLKQIAVTHAHIDHVGGALQLKRATGAPVLLNQNDLPLLQMMEVQAGWLGIQPPEAAPPDASAEHGMMVGLAEHPAQVLHTPGHTPGSICLLFEKDHLLLAGDTLFAGSIGRTDLPGGDPEQILRSIHDRLLPLPDGLRVIPGHGPATTIGEERESNPFLR
jgi:hydroxyacylglutathione hydrolase